MSTESLSSFYRWPRCVLVICGHPCCLKSSVSRALSSDHETMGLFTHQLGRISAMWGEPFFEQRARRYRNTRAILETTLGCDVSVIVEGTYSFAAERAALRDICNRHNYPCILVYAYSSDDSVIEQRFAHRALQTKGPDHHANDISIYYDSLRCFESITPIESGLYAGYAAVDSARKVITAKSVALSLSDGVLGEVESAYQRIGW